MNRYYYKKANKKNLKTILRAISLSIFILGFLIGVYISFPLISWQLYFAPVFASQEINSPIPKTTIVTASSIKSLINSAVENMSGINYSNAQNWFPDFNPLTGKNNLGIPKISSYSLSIPKLNIKDAAVTTVDNNLDIHLVNYLGTAIPPDNGNAVIYGHSTLPQLFNPKDYKTIFATLHTLRVADEFSVNVSGIIYSYKIFSITVVDPSNISIFTQNYDDGYITLVTCTPPGTVWKRLIVKARLQKI